MAADGEVIARKIRRSNGWARRLVAQLSVHNWSDERIAAKIGVSVQTIEHWAYGESTPKGPRALSLERLHTKVCTKGGR